MDKQLLISFFEWLNNLEHLGYTKKGIEFYVDTFIKEAKPPIKKILNILQSSSFAYRVELFSICDKKLNSIKIIKDFTGFGLKESKETADSAPCIINKNFDKKTALNFALELSKYNAIAQVLKPNQIK